MDKTCKTKRLRGSRLAARATVDTIVSEAKKLCRLAEFEVPHVFEKKDFVYLPSSPFPYIVVRSGYGAYREEVRIRRWDEPARYESGVWKHYSQLILLDIHDKVVPLRDITVATEDEFVITAGTTCIFEGFDADDDGKLRVLGSTKMHLVLDQDFLHFNIQR